MFEDRNLLNKIAQDKFDFSEGIDLFNNLETEKQRRILNQLIFFIHQSHPTKESIDMGLEIAPIKKTMTPVIIFQTHNLNIALDKIKSISENEYENSFVTMMSIFKIADTKRRELFCKDGCSHAWYNLK